MSDAIVSSQHAQAVATRRALEGEERIPLLSAAEVIAVSAGAGDEPPYVFICWTADIAERPYPGTALWRAAMGRYLASPVRNVAAEDIIRPLVESALARFDSLETWLRWMDHARDRSAAAVSAPDSKDAHPRSARTCDPSPPSCLSATGSVRSET